MQKMQECSLLCSRDDWTTFEPFYTRPAGVTETFGYDWGSMSNNWKELANTCRYLAGQLSNSKYQQFTIFMPCNLEGNLILLLIFC